MTFTLKLDQLTSSSTAYVVIYLQHKLAAILFRLIQSFNTLTAPLHLFFDSVFNNLFIVTFHSHSEGHDLVYTEELYSDLRRPADT